MNHIQKRILLLLEAGDAFGYAYVPGRKWQALKKLSREWKKLDKKSVYRGMVNLYRVGDIARQQQPNGFIFLVLTEKGSLKALQEKLDVIKLKKQPWDKKWRMVAFDIPEKYKKGRDALRQRLLRIGFAELQKSVFITPYDCQQEMTALVAFFKLDKYVRFGILSFIDNELYFKKRFNL